jgi:hypothetical protein
VNSARYVVAVLLDVLASQAKDRQTGYLINFLFFVKESRQVTNANSHWSEKSLF